MSGDIGLFSLEPQLNAQLKPQLVLRQNPQLNSQLVPGDQRHAEDPCSRPMPCSTFRRNTSLPFRATQRAR